MLAGSLPFQGSDEKTIRCKVCTFTYRWPDEPSKWVSSKAKGLVAGLLVKASSRLSPDEVVEHPFVANGQHLDGMDRQYRAYAPCEP